MTTDSTSPLPTNDPERIEATAAVWLSLRDRGMSESETAAFMRWLQQDARHAEAFNALDLVWREFNRAAALRPAAAGEPEAALLDPQPRRPFVRLRARWTRSAGRRRPMLAGALAAAAALTLAWVGFRAVSGPPPTAVTGVGAFQRLELEDGSVVQLNTDSAVNVRYTPTERRVQLLRGEAHFTVAKNPARPFTVAAGRVAVRAVGTAFNVRLRPEAVEVLVTEGRVEVKDSVRGESLLGRTAGAEPAVLTQGERAVIAAVATVAAPAATALVEPVSAPVIERTLAWQERRLEFDATPLSEVVAEFNRYNRHQIVIADPRLAAKQFGGNFRADGHEAFVSLLEASFDVVAEREGGRTVLHSRR